jgi:hypothetical protein
MSAGPDERGGSGRPSDGVESRQRCLLLAWLAFALVLACVVPGSGWAAVNPVQVENGLPGTVAWELPGATPSSIPVESSKVSGYASESSVQPGDVLHFHVSTTASASYRIEIYRLGWYQGLGGRLIGCVPVCGGSEPGVQQPVPAPDPTTGYLDAGWPVTDTVTVGPGWTSGYYLAKLVLTSGASVGGASYIAFIVRAAPGVSSAILVQAAVNTWQAYNAWGGKSLYTFNSTSSIVPSSTTNAASQVSFNRPGLGTGQGPLQWEFNIVRFLERNGYDVSYQADTDTDQNPGSLLNHRLDIIPGHNEYWSPSERDAWDTALSAGVNLAFLGGDIGEWQARYADPTDRTLIEYRSASIDPSPIQAQKTTEFRNLNPPRPECLLEGEQDLNGLNSTPPSPNYAVAPGALTNAWFTGTGFTQSTLINGVVGYEWDTVGQPGCPTVQTLFTWTGTNTYGLPSKADASTYTAPSSARVFAAGTEQFGWALDNLGHKMSTSAPLQAFMQNLLNDLSSTGSAPANTTLPAITGSTVQGNQLTATTGTWSGAPAPTLSDQWQRCDTTGATCTPITGATSPTYTTQTADIGATLEIAVTATNTAGTATATSAPTTIIAAAVGLPPSVDTLPVELAPPTITGAATESHTLATSAGTWTGNPAPTFTYQWEECSRSGTGCAPIARATARTLLLNRTDVGHRVRVVEHAANVAGTVIATSSASAVVHPIPAAQVKAQMLKNLGPNGTISRIRALLKKGASVAFTALTAGRATLGWYYVPKPSRGARGKQRPLLVATAHMRFAAPATARLAITLTPSGRRLLTHSRRLSLILKGTFTPQGEPTILATKTITLTH